MRAYQIKKKSRPLSLAEQSGMLNLLSGLKEIREKATRKPAVSSVEPGRDTLTIYPIP